MDACWRGAAVSFIDIGLFASQSMVAANRIIRFLGMRAVNCKLSAPATNFKAGRYCRYRLRKALSSAKSACANNVAVIYAGLGEKDEAFRWLQRAYDEPSYIHTGRLPEHG